MKMLNPVFRKDMRVLFRNIKVYIGLTIYLLILVFITNSILKMINLNSYNGFNPEYVMGAYLTMLGFQMLVITFVIPAFTSSSISGERERQTLDFMLITRMKTFDIVLGKLMSSIMLVCLMIVASMPVYAVIFYYGGVSVINFLFNTVFLIIYSAFIGSIAVFFSTIFKKTAAATAVSNLFVIGLSIGTATAAGTIITVCSLVGVNDIARSIAGIICVVLISLNPVVSFVSVIDTQLGSDLTWEFIGGLLDSSIDIPFLQVWHIVLIMYMLVTFLLLKAAAINLRPIKKSGRKNKNTRKTADPENN